MIAYIKGILVEAWDKCAIVLCSGGIGYRLILPEHTQSTLPDKGQEVSFFTAMAVREDAIELFGFSTFEERQMFEILRTINKVGARTALAVLAVYRPAELRQIVLDENIGALTKVAGIGKKTAEHVFLELKYKLPALERQPAVTGMPAQSGVYGDVMAALSNLGYGSDECGAIVRAVLKAEPDLDVASAIRKALKELARGKA